MEAVKTNVIGTDNTNYVYVGKKIDHTLENLERINDLNVKYIENFKKD